MVYLIREPATDAGYGADSGDVAGNTARPGAGLLLTEPIRGLADLAALTLASPWLAIAPRGDGHGVLVWPGLLASDTSTAVLRQFLRLLGYEVRGWDLGRNHGPTDAVLDGLPRVLRAHAERTGRPVHALYKALGRIRRTLMKCIEDSVAETGQPPKSRLPPGGGKGL